MRRTNDQKWRRNSIIYSSKISGESRFSRTGVRKKENRSMKKDRLILCNLEAPKKVPPNPELK